MWFHKWTTATHPWQDPLWRRSRSNNGYSTQRLKPCDENRLDHVTRLVPRKLHGLRIFSYTFCLQTYKPFHGLAPLYIVDFHKPLASIASRISLRSAGACQIRVPGTRTKIGDRSFSVVGSNAFNELPQTVHITSSKRLFKTRPLN